MIKFTKTPLNNNTKFLEETRFNVIKFYYEYEEGVYRNDDVFSICVEPFEDVEKELDSWVTTELNVNEATVLRNVLNAFLDKKR